jgi:hypothetical protein
MLEKSTNSPRLIRRDDLVKVSTRGCLLWVPVSSTFWSTSSGAEIGLMQPVEKFRNVEEKVKVAGKFVPEGIRIGS